MQHSGTYYRLIEKVLRSGLDGAAAEELNDRLYHRSFRAKETIFSQGDSHPDVLFLLTGYVQLYTTDPEGNSSVRALAGPGDFVACVEALLYDQPSHYTAEAVTECQVAILDHHLQQTIKSNAVWQAILQDFVLRRIIQLAREKDEMLPMKATDRYLFFQERYPRFMEHIPAGIIANYIGVRPQSLSRIKHSLK